MKAANDYHVVPSEDKALMDQVPAMGMPPPTLASAGIKTFPNGKCGRKIKQKKRFLICCSNVEMAVLDEEGEENFGHDGNGKQVAPGLMLGGRSRLVMCFSNMEVGTKPKSAEK